MMHKIDYLSLVSGQEIFLAPIGLIARPPKVKEVAMLGEENFYSSCSFLQIEKEKVLEFFIKEHGEEKAKAIFGMKSEYEILIQIMDSSPDMINGVLQIFELLFPEYKISFEEIGIFFMKEDSVPVVLRNEEYIILRDCLKQILCLNPSDRGEQEYNPANDQAAAIAEKLKARKRMLDERNNKGKKSSTILGNYVSSLAIGTNAYTMDNITDLTIFQLFDQVKRFGAWQKEDYAIRAQFAGAKDVEHHDWFGDLE